MNKKRPSRLECFPVRALRRQAIADVRSVNPPPELVHHLEEVANLAFRIAQQIVRNGSSVRLDVVYFGAVFHDIGRIRDQGIRHALEGAKIVRSLGYGQAVARAVERHMVGGISKSWIEEYNLDLPKRSFTPHSIEEKIVAVADQLLHQRSVSGVFLVEEPVLNQAIQDRIFALEEEIMIACFRGPCGDPTV